MYVYSLVNKRRYANFKFHIASAKDSKNGYDLWGEKNLWGIGPNLLLLLSQYFPENLCKSMRKRRW